MHRLIGFFSKEMNGLHETAYLLGFFTLLSQVLGLIRDRLLAHMFGASATLDLYYASFRIPDFIFVTAASVVSISVLVPFLIEKIEHNEKESREFIDTVFSFFFFFMFAVSLIAFFAVPYLLRKLFPGFDPSQITQLISLTRILLLSPILLGISNFLASITQVYRRFVMYALSPLFYNLGIIVGVIFFYPMFGLKGLALGVVLGAVMHLSIQLPFVFSRKMIPHLRFNISFAPIRRVVILSLSRTLALSISSIALLFLSSLASLMAQGSLSVLAFSMNLQSVPIGIIGVSYSVALFPTLSRLFTGDKKKEFIEKIITASRHIIFWSLPLAVFFIVLRAQIVRTVLGSGQFKWDDTRLTAACLGIFIIALLAQNLVLLFIRSYYAAGNTRKPLIINIIAGVVTIASAYGYVKLFYAAPFFRYFIETLFKVEDINGTSVLMLALGSATGSLVNLVLFWIFFERDFKHFSRGVAAVFFQAFSASVIMGFVIHQALTIFDDIFNITTLPGIFFQGFCAGIIGIIVGIFILKLLKSHELSEVWTTLHHKIWRVKPIVSEQESL